MEELPPELTQIICSNLTPKDLKSVRLTSKQLAASGACYILPRVFLFNCKKSFDELKEIAQHPTFSKHVTTLIYDATDLHDFDTDFARWNKARPDTCDIPRWEDFEPYQKMTEGVIDDRSDRAMRRARTLFRQACDRCPEKLAVTERLWDLHRSLVDEQRSEGIRELRVQTMKLAFSSCPMLDHIIFGDDHHIFSKRRARLFTGLPILHVGNKPNMVAIWNDISTARASAGRSVRHLTIPVSIMTDKHQPILREVFSPYVTTATMQGIRSLTLTVHDPLASQLHANVPRRHVCRLLQSASQLEVLKIHFSPNPARGWIYCTWDTARIHPLLNDAQWKVLHTITLSNCCDMEDVFVRFLLRHKESLGRLAIKNCQLLVGSWTSLLTRIAGRLSALRQVILTGDLISRREVEIHLPTQGKLTTSLAIELQTFIIEGGISPPSSSVEAWAGLPIDVAQERFDEDEEEHEARFP